MACSMFDDRDGFIDEADPVSPLSNPDAGIGTAVLERPEEETKLDDGGNGDGMDHCQAAGTAMRIVSRIMCRAIALPSPVAPDARWWRCAARCGCRSVILRNSRYARIASVSTMK